MRLTKEFVQEAMKEAESGHDYNHITRVYRLAKRVFQAELQADSTLDGLVVRLSALLHDVDDWKFKGEGDRVSPFLDSLGALLSPE